MSTVRQNLSLSLKESVQTIRNLLKDAAEMKQVAHKSCLKKLEALAFDVDNVLDELNKIEINKNKLTPENYLNVAEIGNGFSCDPNHEVGTESKIEKHNRTTENYLSIINDGKVLSYHDPDYRVDIGNDIEKYKTQVKYPRREMAVDGLIAGVKLLLGKLASFPIMTEFGLLWNLEGELENLKRSAKTIQSFLDDIAELNQVSGKSTKDWLQDLEAAALDADYVFEELSYQLVRSKVEEMKESTGCADFLSISNNQIINRHTVAAKVKDISKQLKAIYETRNGLGLPMRSYASGGRGPASTLTPSYDVTYGAIVGRENDVRKLADMVCSPAAREQRVSVLPIVGMGGLGKTALAEAVYSNERVLSHFGKRIWMTVSANFNVDILFNSLLAPLAMPGENNTGFQRREVLRRIQEKLMHKTYLLVLDDVWNEHQIVWDDFITALIKVSFGKGNVVLVTTRKEKVIHPLIWNPPPLCVHNLGLLSNEDCWFIIKAVTNFNSPDSELEAIGKSIAARCGGLPLAAHVVARRLRDQSKDEWISIQRNWISDLDNSISTILKRSFDDFSSAALKKCFAYCSIIPKGYCVEKEGLIELWMAEGLLQADKKSDMEGAGNIILNDLVQSSLLQVLERDSLTGDAKKLVTHPLVADLALSLLQPDLLDQDDHQCRYIISQSTPRFQIKKHAKHLRTLFLYSKFSDKMLSRLERLHTLTLIGEDIMELPISIGELIHLKYLDTANTRIETLPESIGNLHLFQTLRATVHHGRESYLRKLPVSFKYLLSLRNLHIPNIELPPGLGNLTSLRTLPYFCVSDKEGCRIAELGKLTNLRGELEIANLGKVRDKEEAESADLILKPNICMLKLAWKNEGGQSSSDDKNVLEGLQPHPNLKILEIFGFKGKSFSSWTMKMAVRKELMLLRLDNLIRLKLSYCRECEEIPMLGQLPHLKCLILSHLTNLKAIGSSFYGNDIGGNGSVFPELQRLELMGLQNLRVWEEVNSSSSSSVSVFPCLEVLVITKCKRLESAPSEFPCLKEFEIFSVESPLPVANICGSKLSTLRKLKIWNAHGLVSLSDNLFSRNRDLSEATILDCKSLTHLGNCGASSSLRKLVVKFCDNLTEFADVGSLDALEDLDIKLCPKLRPIPYSSLGSSTLRTLHIISCNNGLTIKMMESCAPSLERFQLKQCENSIAQHVLLMKIIEEKMPRLTTLGYELPRVMDETFMFPALQSLSKLTLIGAGANAIPESLCHFTALHCLSLEEFGTEALPDWLGSLPSLQLLYIFECPKLSRLPSHNTNLTQLHITECPLLTKALEVEPRNLNSEWSKISHIPYIQLDYNQITQHGPATPAFELIDIYEMG